MTEPCIAKQIKVEGRIQGVGYRPFVLRLARRLNVRGWVRNLSGSVDIHAEGTPEALNSFEYGLIAEAPPLARPVAPLVVGAKDLGYASFEIRESQAGITGRIVIAPDHFVCQDCLAEMADPSARRYRYPFTNCTQCGPRYTIIDRLPYDRPNTAMASFPLCAACRTEYEDPSDRRYHAQPLACPVCGPELAFNLVGKTLVTGNEPALAACVTSLRAGCVIAVKGVGGYHLLCDARSDVAVQRLRERKHRPEKPLAVLLSECARGDDQILTTIAEPDADEWELLSSPLRPIVLVRKAKSCSLSEFIAPGLNEVGLMLPYSPLHHLLSADFGGPLVATSANISGEPVLTDAVSVESRLQSIADAFLHHNRPIRRPADDSVFRKFAGRLRPMRLGRGLAPVEMRLRQPVKYPLLALGADLKNTVALAVDDRVTISPHLGDLGAPRSLVVFEQVVDDLCQLFGVNPEVTICDAHPGYFSSGWARSRGGTIQTVFHHHAHASAVYGEFDLEEDLLVFTWDGLGYGDDGTMWGGEALFGSPGHWQRVASLKPFRLIGGDRASREPWRCALSVCLESGLEWVGAPSEAGLAKAVWERGINSPFTSSAGRLFDAAAALIGMAARQSYEGHAAMMLESACSNDALKPIELPLSFDGGIWRGDWTPLLPMLMDTHTPPETRAAIFHSTLAELIVTQALQVREHHGAKRIGLSGGVFQNRRLVDIVVKRLQGVGFNVLIPHKMPVNDAAISWGQIIESQAGESTV